MIELKAHDRTVASFEALVERLGPDAVASPRRSTVPLLDYWRVPEPRLVDLGARLGVSWSDNTELHFEYEVPVQRGRGKSSYTDLMIIGNDVAVSLGPQQAMEDKVFPARAIANIPSTFPPNHRNQWGDLCIATRKGIQRA